MPSITYALIHSPLVGPVTWSLVADVLRQRGTAVLAPETRSDDRDQGAFWERHARSVADEIRATGPQTLLVLVGHSGAGVLLPAIRQAVRRPVAAYVFVDAGIPQDGEPRLVGEDAMRMLTLYERGERFPNWTDGMLANAIPDTDVRQRLLADVRPQPWSFWIEPIPVFQGWPDAPCAYVRFGTNPAYEQAAAEAQKRGWRSVTLEGDHFHMLVDPDAVANALVDIVRRVAIIG